MAAVNSASANLKAMNAIAADFGPMVPTNAFEMPSTVPKRPMKGRRGCDGGEGANSEPQVSSEHFPLALKGSVGSINGFSVGEMRRRGAEDSQAGGDHGRHMAPLVAHGDGNYFVEPAVAQGCGAIPDESARLHAGSAVTVGPVGNNGDRIRQHEPEQQNITAAEPTHRTP
jgi:hypothetical protein